MDYEQDVVVPAPGMRLPKGVAAGLYTHRTAMSWPRTAINRQLSVGLHCAPEIGREAANSQKAATQ
jgi:hypothetical protein